MTGTVAEKEHAQGAGLVLRREGVKSNKRN
jgi:hypothetical protein